MGKLQHIQHQISAINDLIKINHDRISGYEKALEGNEDTAFIPVFTGYADQSKKYAGELEALIHSLGGEPAAGTTLTGKFYRTWLDIKSKVTGKDNKSILSDCEYGEEVINKAYRDALDDKELIWEDKQVVNLLTGHLKGLKLAYENIKALRADASKPPIST
jgi:uncharacterized protein (TIGR02284 family)